MREMCMYVEESGKYRWICIGFHNDDNHYVVRSQVDDLINAG